MIRLSRWRERATLLVIGAVLGGGAGALASASLRAEASGQSPPTTTVASAPARERVHLGQQLAQRAGIRVAAVEESSIAPGIEVVGAIALDPARVSDVGGRVVGRVAEYFVEHGDRVEAGAPLVRIETAELGDAIAEWLAALAELEAASARLERERGLATRQLATAGTVERAEAEEGALTARARGAEHRLLAMGLGRGELERVARGGRIDGITLRAPIAGEIIERTAMLGEVVEPTDPILRIAALDTVWVLLDVYERDLARVREGDDVEVRTETAQGTSIRGHVEHVDAIVDPETRTGRVRVSIDNADRVLRPGQYVYARLSRDAGARRGVLAPRSAILQLGGEPASFVAVGDEEYEVRPLRLGASLGDLVEVEAGLARGDRLVVDGAFALKSELQR
ncbi:efflux RND transporter periplasmic adaptor subunit [Sandaracinus amylolyticus]|uniref:efflux RND transporter periplasmic adaptor subunit n=1 Tax=Sandaracinus amylolyticus TaxID=927083 RepID=UPI001F20CC15|nr:efflux RND transporter periplasmic adaptor subunit [Sandaracinus amylolyticus]UJR84673.1 Hypothetical protein I5071_67520 [Sandaracinus amylolyticus]